MRAHGKVLVTALFHSLPFRHSSSRSSRSGGGRSCSRVRLNPLRRSGEIPPCPRQICPDAHRLRRIRRMLPAMAPPLSIDVGGTPVPLDGAPGLPAAHVQQAVESNVFRQWIRCMTGERGILSSGGRRCALRRVTVQSVDFFGPRVGFVKFRAEVVDEATGARLPGIVFGRGGAVGVLILLESGGETFAVLTEQPRVPVGRTLLELPAGMLDAGSDGGDFVGTAAREIEEETGIKVRAADLTDLTALLDASTGRRMFPSPGGSDEDVTLFLYRGRVERGVIEALQGVETGLREHGELIKVHVVPYASLWRATADCKALAAIALYEMASREGVLPPPPNAPDLADL